MRKQTSPTALKLIAGIACSILMPALSNIATAEDGYDVAAYYWPAYHSSDPRWNQLFVQGNEGEWEIIRNSKPKYEGHRQPRVPLWGYEDATKPEVMEKKIDAAHQYGVDVFIFDWFWYEGQPFLEQVLEEGYLKAKNNDKVKFYLMWGNCPIAYAHDIRKSHVKNPYGTIIYNPDVNRQEFDKLVDIWVEYMKHPSYYRIDGEPVFSVYETSRLIRNLGGFDKTRIALEYFESKAKEAGFPGLHLQGILWSEFPKSAPIVLGDKTPTQDSTVLSLGFDSLTNYQYVHLDAPNKDYLTWANNATRLWDNWSKDFSIPYFPHVSVDWDTNPRFVAYVANIKKGNNPNNFKKYLLKAKAYVDAHPDQPRLVTINSWNEWSEGSYLEPDTDFGYGYLEAIRDVFGGEN